MTSKYKDILCNLAIKILSKYNVGHSEDLKRFTYIKHDGKYYAIDDIHIASDINGVKCLEIDAYQPLHFAKKYSHLNK